jgi:hypothetical protein
VSFTGAPSCRPPERHPGHLGERSSVVVQPDEPIGIEAQRIRPGSGVTALMPVVLNEIACPEDSVGDQGQTLPATDLLNAPFNNPPRGRHTRVAGEQASRSARAVPLHQLVQRSVLPRHRRFHRRREDHVVYPGGLETTLIRGTPHRPGLCPVRIPPVPPGDSHFEQVIDGGSATAPVHRTQPSTHNRATGCRSATTRDRPRGLGQRGGGRRAGGGDGGGGGKVRGGPGWTVASRREPMLSGWRPTGGGTPPSGHG